METLSAEVKQRFKAKRYMDDCIVVYAKSPTWDHAKFVREFSESKCYHPPLRLEDGTQNTFLETTFRVEDDRFRYWLKNDNVPGMAPRKWRYQHWRSHSPFLQKRALLQACLQKVAKMASDRDALYHSALQKLAEFAALQYPRSVLRGVCTYLGATTGEGTWINVRHAI